MSWSCSYQFFGASGLWLILKDWLLLLAFRFRLLRVGLVLIVEGLSVAAVWNLILVAFCLRIVDRISNRCLAVWRNSRLMFCPFSVEKAAVGRLICFAGSFNVVWCKPLLNWHRLVDCLVCLWWFLLRHFVHRLFFANNAISLSRRTKLVFRASCNTVIAFAIFAISVCVETLRRRIGWLRPQILLQLMLLVSFLINN